MVIESDICFRDIKDSLFNLFVSWHVRIKLKFLGHLFDDILLSVVFVLNIFFSLLWHYIWIKGDTSVNQSIFSTLVSFEMLFANLFFSVDHEITVSMMIEVYFSVSVIHLNQLLPIVEFIWWIIVFNRFKLIWESASQS